MELREVSTVNATNLPDRKVVGSGSVAYESVLQSFIACHHYLCYEKSKDELSEEAKSRNGRMQIVSTEALTHVQKA